MHRPVTCMLLLLAAVSGACGSERERARPTPADAAARVPAVVPVPAPIDPPASAGALAPNLHATGTAVLATWLEPAEPTGSHQLRFSRWQDGVWTAPVTIAQGPGIVANWADVPSAAAGADGNLVAHWAEKSGEEPYAYDAVVARSTDQGATWVRLGTLHADRTPAEHGFVSLVEDGGGVRAIWLDGRAAATGGPTALRSALVTEEIGDEEVIDPRVCDCCGTAAGATNIGTVVVYRDRTDDELRDIAAASRGASGGWTEHGLVHADRWQIAGCPVNGPALAVSGDLVATAWYTYADATGRVRVAFSSDRGATFGPPIDVDVPSGARAPIGRVGVVLDDDGSAIVSWTASAREQATVLLRRITSTGERGAELALATTGAGRDAGFPRLSRSGRDLIAIWTEPPGSEPNARSRLRAVRLARDVVQRTGLARAEPAQPHVRAAEAGKPVPPITAVALDGAKTDLASRRGQIVLLNVWATWCEPCRHELPELAKLHEQRGKQGLEVIALSVDQAQERGDIAAFVAKRKLPFTVWHDQDDLATTALDAAPLPVTFLIDRDGTIVWRHDGAIRADDPALNERLDAALRSPR